MSVADLGLAFTPPQFVLRNANMQITTDQAFTKRGVFTSYVIRAVIAKLVSGGATVACLGGVYTAAGKTGNILVAAAQSWINLTATGKIVQATLPALIGTDLQTATPILALSTGSTAACVADLFIFADVVD